MHRGRTRGRAEAFTGVAVMIQVQCYSPQQAYQALTAQVWPILKAHTMAGRRMVLSLQEEKRTTKQNRLMWSCLTDLSKQVKWFGKRMTPEGWKNWITGHLNGQELHPNMDGTGFISVTKGTSTSGMTIKEMIAVVDLCHAFGAEKDVVWSKTSLGRGEYVVDKETGEILETT